MYNGEDDNVMVELPVTLPSHYHLHHYTQVTDNQISKIIKSETAGNQEIVASTSTTVTEFVDCGETIKEEIKEEVEDEYQRDPLILSNAVQSLDESVTYEEFFVSTKDTLQESSSLDEFAVKDQSIEQNINLNEENLSLIHI